MVEKDAVQLLYDVKDVADSVGIRYMLYGGTCLGAVRDKKFIDIDRDVDFACLHEDFMNHYPALTITFRDKGFDVHFVDHRHEKDWDGTPYGLKLSKYGINSDFFGHFKHKNYRYVPSHYGNYILAHRADLIEDLKPIMFYDKEFLIPKNEDEFLTVKYGNWKEQHNEFYNISKPTCRYEGDDFWSL